MWIEMLMPFSRVFAQKWTELIGWKSNSLAMKTNTLATATLELSPQEGEEKSEEGEGGGTVKGRVRKLKLIF